MWNKTLRNPHYTMATTVSLRTKYIYFNKVYLVLKTSNIKYTMNCVSNTITIAKLHYV